MNLKYKKSTEKDLKCPTVRDTINHLKKMKKKGYKPYLKGKKGSVKIEYE